MSVYEGTSKVMSNMRKATPWVNQSNRLHGKLSSLGITEADGKH